MKLDITTLINKIENTPEGLTAFELAVEFDESPREIINALQPHLRVTKNEAGEFLLRSGENFLFRSMRDSQFARKKRKGEPQAFNVQEIRSQHGISPWRTVVAEFEKGTLKAGELFAPPQSR